MCGRYASFLPAEALARAFGTIGPLPNLEPTWNMAPTKDAPIVRFDPDTSERRLEVAKWGLVPFFTKDLAKARKPINARCETVARSSLFKEAFARRRCLVPAAAYYEWRHDPSGKTPFAIGPPRRYVMPGLLIEFVKRSDHATGFVVEPMRWIVERLRSLPPACQGLGEPQPQRSRLSPSRLHTPHAPKALQSFMKFPDGLTWGSSP
jgi:hypothetical protein